MTDTAELLAGALVVLARYGVPPDVQELLVYGNAQTGVKPAALQAALREAVELGARREVVRQEEMEMTRQPDEAAP